MRADLVPDDLWERVAPLLPLAPERRRRYPGRLRVPDRAALAGVMYVLRTGVAWRDVPAETVGCAGATAWRRLRDWTEAGVWPRLHAALLTELRRADLLDLDDCSVDGSHVRALKGGSRRSLARRPCPFRLQAPPDRRLPRNAVTLTGGNRHDVTQLQPCWTPSHRFEVCSDAPAASPGVCTPTEATTSTSTAACCGSAASNR
uniref:Transposase n=1 Tax=Streptomyces sp. FR1 TaxID=349971 RepID=V9Z3J0_9ACTN|nr:Transposase [Streptomyces sp. FR1]